ncbi:MAG TPA: signal peptidase I [Acidimicrobiales bacterium]|nr:signal peptidase I [Acidimicrobiales bacterium]
MSRVLKTVLVAALPALLLVGALLLLTGQLPYKVYVVHTGSMTPTIPTRSLVIVREHHFHVGQVVSFHVNGGIVTHRLLAIDKNGTITTKGDANATDDPWHPPVASIIGGVVAAPRYLGYWLMYARNPFGFASVLLMLLVLWQIWTLPVAGRPRTTAAPASVEPSERAFELGIYAIPTDLFAITLEEPALQTARAD